MILSRKAKYPSDDYVCELTDICDNMRKGYLENSNFKTSVIGRKQDDCYCIRLPGATRGHIEVDSHDTIINISIYSDNPITDCYHFDLENVLNGKFKDDKMVFEKREGNYDS